MESNHSHTDGPPHAHNAKPPAQRKAAPANRQLAYCECGARLAGDSIQALLDAAERHFLQRHGSLFGAALGTDRVAH